MYIRISNQEINKIGVYFAIMIQFEKFIQFISYFTQTKIEHINLLKSFNRHWTQAYASAYLLFCQF